MTFSLTLSGPSSLALALSGPSSLKGYYGLPLLRFDQWTIFLTPVLARFERFWSFLMAKTSLRSVWGKITMPLCLFRLKCAPICQKNRKLIFHCGMIQIDTKRVTHCVFFITWFINSPRRWPKKSIDWFVSKLSFIPDWFVVHYLFWPTDCSTGTQYAIPYILS